MTQPRDTSFALSPQDFQPPPTSLQKKQVPRMKNVFGLLYSTRRRCHVRGRTICPTTSGRFFHEWDRQVGSNLLAAHFYSHQVSSFDYVQASPKWIWRSCLLLFSPILRRPLLSACSWPVSSLSSTRGSSNLYWDLLYELLCTMFLHSWLGSKGSFCPNPVSPSFSAEPWEVFPSAGSPKASALRDAIFVKSARDMPMLDMFEFHQGFDIRCIPLLDPLSTLLPLGMFLLSACGAHHLCLFLMISLAATSSCFPQRASRIVMLLPLQNLQLLQSTQ